MNNNFFSKIVAFVFLALGLVNSNESIAQYCTPIYTSVACGTTQEQDFFVSFATTGGATNITNNQACPTASANYSYYSGSGSTVTAMQGSTINFTFVTTPSFAENVKIWVDWNQDDLFDATTELAYNSAINFPAKIPASTTVTDAIIVPITATIGLTRMRARMVFSNQVFTDCSSESFGETEDYDFVVTPALPCVAPPVGGIAAVNNTVVCSGTDVNLSLSGVSLGVGETYQWQESANGINFTDISGATGLTASTTVTGQTTYRCVVTCSGQQTNSTNVVVTLADISGSMAVASDSTICANSVVAFSLTNVPTSQTLSFQWQESPDGISYTDISGANSDVFNYMVLDTAYVRCVASCGTQTSNSSAVMLTLNSAFDCYCTTNLNGSCVTASITDFSIIGTTLLNPANGCNTVAGSGSYTNFPNGGNTTATLAQYATYSVDLGTTSPSRVAIWIDYDHSGTFEASEWTQLAGGTLPATVGGVPYTSSFTVSGSALLGLTKMRIRSRGSANNLVGTSACASFATGETEDYYITIGLGSPCLSPPNAGIAAASIDSACYGQNFTLSLSGNSVGTGQTYQWQSSLDNNTWVDILGANSDNTTASQNAKNYYRCLVTCSGQTVASAIDSVNDGHCVIMGDQSITTCNATYFDSNPTGNYQINENSTLTVYPSGVNNVVSINFNSFNTEDGSDFLDIFDGVDANSPSLASYTGNTIPPSVQATNPTGALTFVFTSDNTVNAAGWNASLSCVAVTPCSGSPIGGNALANDSSVCENSTVNLSLSGNTTDFGISYQWQSSLDGVTFNDELGAISTSYDNVIISDTTYFRCKLKCGTDSSYSTIVEITFNPFYQCYCGPATAQAIGGTCGANNIDSVSIANTSLINNVGGCNTSTSLDAYTAYPGFGNTTATLQQLVPYQLSVTNNGNSIQSVWIDYDHSGTFDDTEWTQISTTSNANIPTLVSILIPSTSLTGLTGMRIRSRGNGSPNGATDACTEFFSGETEDYVINISAAQPCVAPPIAGTTVSNVTTVCENSAFILSLNGNSVGVGQTYQWQESSNGTTFTDVVGETTESFNATIGATATYYQCNITCSNQTVSSTPIMVNVVNCYLLTSGIDSVVTTCSGVFLDSGGDVAGFSSNENGSYTFYPSSANSAIQLTFSSFATEPNFDGLMIFNGPDASYPLISSGTTTTNNAATNPLGAWNGTNSPGTVTSTDLSGALTFVWASDGSNNPSGWFATISCVSASACSGTPIGGSASAQDSSVCENSNVALTLDASSTGTGITYQWQESPDNIIWTDIFGANNLTATAIASDTTYYRCKVKCLSSADSSYSTVVLVTFNQYYECYCGPATSQNIGGTCGANDITDVSIATTTLNNTGTSCNTIAGIGAYTLYPASGNTTATLQQLVPYQLSVTNNGNSIQSIWIDYDHSGTFDANEWQQISTTSTANTATIITLSIPVTSLTGITGMRLRSRSSGSPNSSGDACTQFFSGETEDYIINIIQAVPCLDPPTAGNTIVADSSVCANSSVTFSLQGNSIGLGQTYQWQSSSNAITFTDITGETNDTYSATITDSVYIKCLLTCGNGSVSSTVVHVTLNSFFDCYCGPSTALNLGGTCGGNDVTDVTIFGTNLDNLGTSCSTITAGGAYSSYPASGSTTATLQQLTPYQLSVTTSGNSIVSVWIDYDQSGTFDSNEWQQVATTTTAATPDIITLIVPVTSLTGLTGMRIRTRGNGNTNGADDACTEFFSGETEDYLITITAAPPCIAPPTAGTVNPSSTIICGGETLTLGLLGNTNGTGQSYQWQSSTNGTTFTDILNATLENITVSQSQTTYYQCVVTCSNQSSTTNSIMITTDCYTVALDSIVACSGTFYDSNPTGNYSDNENFTSTIYPSIAGNMVSVTFNSFATEANFDGLLIFDGPDSSYPLISSGLGAGTNAITCPVGSWRGSVNPGTVTSSDPSGALTFVFTTDGSGTPAGWDATINCIYIPPCTGTPIAGTITASSTGACAGVDFQLDLTGSSVATGLSYTWQSANSASGPWATIGTTQSITTSQSNSTYYQCIVNCGGASATTVPFMMVTDCYTIAQDSISVCSGTFYDSNPTGNYGDNESFTSTIFPGIAGNMVSVTFNTFSTENNFDGLLIYDGPDSSYPLITSGLGAGTNATTCPIGSWRGTVSPGTITSTDPSGALTFVFTSDGSGTPAGWDATISCVSVAPCATPIVTAMGATNFCQGDSIMLMSNVSTVTWTAIGLNNGSTSSSIYASQAGQYYVTNTNALCAGQPTTVTNSNIITVTINPAPSSTTIFADDNTLCTGGVATLTATPVISGATYTWTGATGNGSTATTSSTGNVSVTVSQNGCSTTSNVVAISVSGLPTAPTITASTPNGFICPQGTVDLTSSYSSGNSWSNSLGNLSTVTVNAAGTYTVTYTDANGCSSSASTAVTNIPGPVVSVLQGSTSACAGMVNVTLGSNAPAGNVWSDNSTGTQLTVTQPGNYFTTVIVPGCAAPIQSNVIAVTVNTPVTAVISASATSICGSANVTLTCNADPSYVSYVWASQSGSGISGTGNSANVTATGVYTVTVTDNNGCTFTSASQTIGQGSAPTPVITPPAVSTVCEPGTITLSTGSAQGAYVWLQNGVVNTALGTSDNIIVNTTGLYSVQVSNNGCTGVSAQVPITINPLPNAAFIGTPLSTDTCSGIVNFTNQSTNASSFQWNFGDSSPQVNFFAPNHTYKASGVYNVTLVVQNSCGSSTTTHQVSICSTIGVDEISADGDVAIFPNPTKDNITVNYNNVDANTFKVEVMSVAGQVLYSETNNQFHGKFQQNIDMSRYAQGVYFVRIVTNKNTISRKIVKE